MKKSKLLLTALLAVTIAIVAQAQTEESQPLLTEKSGYSSDDLVECFNFESYNAKPIKTAVAPTVIAFGSCNKITMPQTMWPFVSANNPDLWIWLGDIVYADTTNMRALAAQYRMLKDDPGYSHLRSKAQVVGIYDDHDYGYNDAGKDYPKKYPSKKRLMNFLDVPRNSPVRHREGSYQSYTFGQGAQSIKVIVMDMRWFRDALEPDDSGSSRYLPNTTGEVLGEVQWRWLEEELKNSKANLNILCSSVQVLANDHGFEKWGNFPNERKRLLQLIASTQPKNLMILSGDRHMAEISKMDLKGLPYPLYDFTSSGLTHIRSGDNERNRYRVGDMILKKNFGVLRIHWDGDKPVVGMEIRGQQNQLYQEVVVKY